MSGNSNPIEPEVTVAIENTSFTVGELQAFIDRVRSIDGMNPNARIHIECDEESIHGFRLYATTNELADV